MKILFMVESPDCWKSGIWFHRIETPSRALKKRGHGIKQIAIGNPVPQEFMDWPDTVVFGRIYNAAFDPIKLMRDYRKAGKRILYDMDDDFWQVTKDNPSVLVSNALKDQYEGMIREADAIITPSNILAKKFKKLGKPVHICPNGINYGLYHERSHEHKDMMIGYMGAASHWKDLTIVIDALEELYRDYNFYFVIYGMVGEPMEAAMYSYGKTLGSGLQPEKNVYYKSALDFYSKLKKLKMIHIPFYPPELHPSVLARADFDIGIAPLENTEFNRGKSCIKFYEYAATGAVTLASDVEPYKSEVNYRAKNTKKDWYKKLKRLLDDDKFRKDLLEKQRKYVKETRNLDNLALDWELACQLPGGLPVLNQEKDEDTNSTLE